MDPYYTAGYIVLAAAIATMIRLEDFPQIEWTKANIGTALSTFVGSVVSVVAFAWIYADQAAIYIDTLVGLAAISMSAAGGIAGLRAALTAIGNAYKLPPPPVE